jgi:antitoxin MazE
MSNAVKSRIIKIGNSKGVRIPKPILEQLALGKEVELSVRGDQLVIRPSQRSRSGWEGQFQRMAERGDDRLLDE